MAVRMATQPNTLDLAQLQGIVTWLEDQQRQDREVIGRLTQEVERLAHLTKEQASYLGIPVEGPYKAEHYRY